MLQMALVSLENELYLAGSSQQTQEKNVRVDIQFRETSFKYRAGTDGMVYQNQRRLCSDLYGAKFLAELPPDGVTIKVKAIKT